MIAYKLLRRKKDGSFGPLFIGKSKSFKFNEWLEAEDIPTKGYAHRPGFHCTIEPKAPHLSTKNRVWVKVQIEDYQIMHRCERQGGKWALAKRMMILEEVNPEES